MLFSTNSFCLLWMAAWFHATHIIFWSLVYFFQQINFLVQKTSDLVRLCFTWKIPFYIPKHHSGWNSNEMPVGKNMQWFWFLTILHFKSGSLCEYKAKKTCGTKKWSVSNFLFIKEINPKWQFSWEKPQNWIES